MNKSQLILNDTEKAIYEKYKWTIEDMGTPIQRAMWVVELEKCIHEAYEAGIHQGIHERENLDKVLAKIDELTGERV